MLLKHFLRDDRDVPPDVLDELRSRTWTGNVRELRNFVERMRALGYTRAVALTNVQAPASSFESSNRLPVAPRSDRETPAPSSISSSTFSSAEVTTGTSFRTFRDRWNDVGEEKYVRELLARHPNNVSAAAREAELNRTYLYKLMRKHGL
jgi:DNA-binding NtrC family response regulator